MTHAFVMRSRKCTVVHPKPLLRSTVRLSPGNKNVAWRQTFSLEEKMSDRRFFARRVNGCFICGSTQERRESGFSAASILFLAHRKAQMDKWMFN